MEDRIPMGISPPGRWTPGQLAYWLEMSKLILGDKLINWRAATHDPVNKNDSKLNVKLANYRTSVNQTSALKNCVQLT